MQLRGTCLPRSRLRLLDQYCRHNHKRYSRPSPGVYVLTLQLFNHHQLVLITELPGQWLQCMSQTKKSCMVCMYRKPECRLPKLTQTIGCTSAGVLGLHMSWVTVQNRTLCPGSLPTAEHCVPSTETGLIFLGETCAHGTIACHWESPFTLQVHYRNES